MKLDTPIAESRGITNTYHRGWELRGEQESFLMHRGVPYFSPCSLSRLLLLLFGFFSPSAASPHPCLHFKSDAYGNTHSHLPMSMHRSKASKKAVALAYRKGRKGRAPYPTVLTGVVVVVSLILS